jgi:hypothetical protein
MDTDNTNISMEIVHPLLGSLQQPEAGAVHERGHLQRN